MQNLKIRKIIDHNVVSIWSYSKGKQKPFFKFGSYDNGAGLGAPQMIRTYHPSTWAIKADNVYFKQQKMFFNGKS